MKKYLPKGFTMIELLIVIAVLGVLAIAVLAAINPIEQINRGRDTGSRSDAEQLLSAIDRYNASQMIWPWQGAADDTDIVPWTQITALAPAAPAVSGGCPMLSSLRHDVSDTACPGTDEVKQSFVNRIVDQRYNALYIEYGGDAGDSVYVCFSPQSMSFSQEAERRCTDMATNPLAGYPAIACTACEDLVGASGTSPDCICLP
ncbi:MAG: prepilin-type N-terminal cleavage/methylation domain-containing protein [Candidatus Marinimicrobia bacterium]|nr:prepilin-type N-terminal cleavage/methylation domain-containing protein [Candidatus Neomarinimicrobiota bacterium]